MKILFKPVLILFAAMILFSCSKDDEAPVTINSVLTSSKEAYEKAENGEWIEITKEEYDLLFTNLSETKKVGLDDDTYEEDIEELSNGGSNFTMVNHGDKVAKIPEDSYIIAFKYSPKSTEDIKDTQVKMNSNTDVTKEYVNVGGTLPTHKGGSIKYFTIKNNTQKTTEQGNLAFYLGYSKAGWSYLDEIDMNIQRNDSNTISDNFGDNSNNHIQAISTTKKQW